MLNTFYNYIGDQLVSFFEEEAIRNKTDRYFLYLPTEEVISSLYQAIGSHKNKVPFHYRHKEGSKSYETYALQIGKIKYVIATTNNTNIDFLVTLRNEMSEQKGDWENTSLILLCNTLNDSIRGGSRDLTGEGLPLHVSNIAGNLDQLLLESDLDAIERKIASHYLNRRESEHQLEISSFLDFEDVLALVNKGTLEHEDYLSLQYFHDSGLEDLVREQEVHSIGSAKWNQLEKKIDKKLTENNSEHEEIERIRSLGNPKEKLEEAYDKGGTKLNREDWFTVDFSDIEDWKEATKSKRAIEFYPEKVKVSVDSQSLSYWKRPKSDTAAGRRNWSLLIFHPTYKEGEKIEITLPFDRHVRKEFLNSTSKKVARTSGHTLIAELTLEQDGATFGRVVYKHENATNGNYTFTFVVLASDAAFFESFRTSFQVVATSKAKRALHFTLDNQRLVFGDGTKDVDLKEQGQSISIENGATIQATPGLLEEDEKNIRFTIVTPRFEIPIEVADEVLKTIPINGRGLWEKKRSIQSSFFTDQEAKRVEIDNLPYTTFAEDRPFLVMEFAWIRTRVRQASIKFNKLFPEQVVLPEAVEKAYDAFLESIEQSGTIPSLLYYTDTIREKAEAYVKAYIDAIENIHDQQIMTNEERVLFHLGTARDEGVIYMTPFSPLNVAYQLQITNESKGEAIDPNILNRLYAVYTLPYLISYEGKLFKPTTDSRLPEWHAFLPSEEVTVGETNTYLAKVVEEKLDQFCDHYDYLFSLDSKAAILLNVINIPNDKEVLRGIVNWLKKQIKDTNSLSELRPIEVVAYRQDMDGYSAFDELNNMGNADEIANRLGIKLSMGDYLAEDVLRSIQQVLHYSKRHISEKVQYSHITFYKMKTEEQVVKQLVKDAPTSINLNGLFTTVTSSKSENGGYRVGFGTGDDSNVKHSLLARFAIKINELAANMTDKGQNPYTKGIAFAMHLSGEDEEYLSSLYSQSHWLTFIDPVLDLKYFQESSDNLVIVHYSDQHSSSNHYDAITVTDKSNQYFNVIHDFLKSQQVTVSDENIEDVIRLFNTFNGEWLLRAVQGRAHDKREKMSVVSAIKQALLHFDNPDVLWVPVSMEEIVRVAGSVKLSKKAGLFSGKTIGKRGNCSDDLLMMGLEKAKDGLKIHMYPVEVKIGLNDSSVIEKGISQVKELKDRLNEQLIEHDTFDARFLRNFFTRLFINNASKMKYNKVWPEKNYTLTPDVINQLLNDEFEIVNTLRANHGHGLVISFKKGARLQVKERRKGVIVLEFPEQSGYDTIAKPMNELAQNYKKQPEKIYTTQSGMDGSDDIAADGSYGYKDGESENIKVSKVGTKSDQTSGDERTADFAGCGEKQTEGDEKPLTIECEKAASNVQTRVEVQNQFDGTGETLNTAKKLVNVKNSVRPLIGLENNQDIFWEFDHSGLSNRHLIIGGRSGQGKTYFIQSLLRDLSRSNQSAVVIDYSSSYTRTQLDQVFLADMGEKLRERIVYHEGFPLNPFLRRKKEVAGVVGKEKPTEVARRVVDVFSSVYNGFGSQQKSALYEAVKRGIEIYDDKMKMEHLLEILEELDSYSNSVLSSITTRIVQFVDIDPFDYESKNQWDEYFAPGGNITIVQLAGYDQDEIKRLMAEFILWDLWYYTQNGTKDKPIPVILDEAQNLDFSDGSPSAKILREGRKFGWSAWFATQTFNNFSKEELSILDNAGTKVYFNPAESEVRVLASRIGNATPEELRMLQKGQCLVLGQFKQADQKLGNPSYHIVKVPAMNIR
ncbi:DNA phosphorothioation-dependent restriction protein DptH [Mesobacillus maritimus]|uniref:DNA phosphorothioation-dependent restriction protein DptH n=1 Tax=Mesobacillus maritimus TaxID=1643336 RepID=A0ABS7KBI0_9BACI|nr:DNA phosphorothioation-dependent restriction protein DptH [Mesobacillus maritimus]MBY0099450.1 DNA phosphorothioation-dependent restriction protein DptH [Mesobacillus maritimus]